MEKAMKPTIEFDVHYKIPLKDILDEDTFDDLFLDDYPLMKSLPFSLIKEVTNSPKALKRIEKELRGFLKWEILCDYLGELNDYDNWNVLIMVLRDILDIDKKFKLAELESKAKEAYSKQDAKNKDKERAQELKNIELAARKFGYKLIEDKS
jgi:hypothetical protein